jgi:hypothetical protein
VSNSSTEFIQDRLNELLANEPKLLPFVSVQSDAGKFRITEPKWDDGRLSVDARFRFTSLPAAAVATNSISMLERPIYLRRGAYFEAIVAVLNGKLDSLKSTVFCGDIWEMDLAMPFALGANVHLIERAPPFSTCRYEREALAACGEQGKLSADLSGLIRWLD